MLERMVALETAVVLRSDAADLHESRSTTRFQHVLKTESGVRIRTKHDGLQGDVRPKETFPSHRTDVHGIERKGFAAQCVRNRLTVLVIHDNVLEEPKEGRF